MTVRCGKRTSRPVMPSPWTAKSGIVVGVTAHNQIVIRLDPATDDERRALADGVSAWLTGMGVIVPSGASPEVRERYGLGDWQPGPAWREVVRQTGSPFGESFGYSVKISGERVVESAIGNSEPPTCRRCGTELDLDRRLSELVEEWLASGEPTPSCSACGWAARLGDWPTEFPPAVVGGPTVTFEDWLPLREEFVAELMAKLVGRCRYFWQRI